MQYLIKIDVFDYRIWYILYKIFFLIHFRVFPLWMLMVTSKSCCIIKFASHKEKSIGSSEGTYSIFIENTRYNANSADNFSGIFLQLYGEGSDWKKTNREPSSYGWNGWNDSTVGITLSA